MTEAAAYRVLLLGAVQLRSQTSTSELQLPRRERALLARLAIDIGRAVSVDRLVYDMWAESPPSSSSNALQVYISHLRQRLGHKAISFGGAGYELTSDSCWVDVSAAERLVREASIGLMSGRAADAATLLDEALAWWRGDPLSDLQDFEFARAAAIRFTDLRANAMQQLAESLLACGNHDRVVSELGPVLQEFPYHEQLRATVMTGLYRQGRAVDALKLYSQAQLILREELGLDPGPGLKAMQAAILADDPTLMRAASQYQSAADSIKRNADATATESRRPRLPLSATNLIGREKELWNVADLLTGHRHRLITLTGPGGTGKTRLALQIASDAGKHFAGDVHLVSLASVTDPQAVDEAIAQTLGASEGGGRTAQQALHEVLVDRRLLLVLDNFEHVIDAAKVVADLMSACARLHVLVTSREPLRLPGEQCFIVPPLPVPGEQTVARGDPAALSRYDSVRLFVERAQSANPLYRVSDDDVRTVARICARLDGLPLAIELAAARTRVMTPKDILARLDRRLELLKGGARGVPSRQKTLRGAIDWSYDLLSEDEQRLFGTLAVFVGGCDLPAIEAICRAVDLRYVALDVLEALVGKSLVRSITTEQGEVRFAMLETVREYASERFASFPDHEAIREKHASHYARLASRTGHQVQLLGGRAWADRIDQEHGNLRAALEWLVEHRRSEDAFTVVAGTWRVWVKRGRLREGIALARHALQELDSSETPAWSDAMTGLGELYRVQGELAEARAVKESTLPYLERANAGKAAVTRTDLGHLAQDEGRLDDALRLHTAALAAHRAVGDERLIAHALLGLARLALATGDLAEAQSHYEYAIAVGRKFDEAEHINEGIIGLGEVASRRGDYRAATEFFAEGLTFALRMGSMDFALDAFLGMTSHAVRGGDMGRATHLLGIAEGIQASTGLVPYFPDEDGKSLRLTMQALGPSEHAAYLEAGRAMTLEEAVAYALLR